MTNANKDLQMLGSAMFNVIQFNHKNMMYKKLGLSQTKDFYS